jgi:hypothetical protein
MAESVAEFRQLLTEDCNLDLPEDEAWRLLHKLVALYRMLMGPIPEDPAVQTLGHKPSGPVDDTTVLE